MNDRFPYFLSPDGSIYAVGDGPELFTFQGNNDAAMWKAFADGYLVGIYAAGEDVFALDHEGRLRRHRKATGEKLGELAIDAAGPHALVGEPGGRLAVVCKSAVVVTDGAAVTTTVKVKGATCAVFGRDRGMLAIGDSGGGVQIVDAADGKARGGASVGAAVAGLAWRVQGQLVAGAGRAISLVSEDGKAVEGPFDVGGAVSHVACSADGSLVAVVIDEKVVAIVGMATKKVIGRITYDRTVRGIAFGTGAWLGIGLEDGDTNRVDLLTGKICKNDPAPGRTANRWGFKVDVEPLAVRQTVTAVRSGGMPIARQIVQESAAEAEEKKKKSSGCWTAAAVGCAIFGLVVVCAGVGGGLFYMYYNQ